MRSLFSGFLTASLAVLGAATVLPAPAGAAELVIRVEGVRSNEGFVRFGVYNTAEEFPRGEKHRRGFVPVNSNSAEIRFSDLEPGPHAVAVYHDENNSRSFDQGLFGIPLEDFGFSNDASVFLGPPDFEEAAFDVSGEVTRIVIDLGNEPGPDAAAPDTASQN